MLPLVGLITVIVVVVVIASILEREEKKKMREREAEIIGNRLADLLYEALYLANTLEMMGGDAKKAKKIVVDTVKQIYDADEVVIVGRAG